MPRSESDWMEHCLLNSGAPNTEDDYAMFREHGFVWPLFAVTAQIGGRRMAVEVGQHSRMAPKVSEYERRGWKDPCLIRVDDFDQLAHCEADIDRIDDWATD